MTDVDLRDLFAAHALGGLVAHGRLAAIHSSVEHGTTDQEGLRGAVSMLCQDAAMIGEQMLRTVRPKATGEKIAQRHLQDISDETNR